VPLEKWVGDVAGMMDGVSSWELHRRLSVTQKTAWFMLHRIRLAVWEAGVGVELEGCSLEEVMRRVLRVSKAELDRRVEEARATSPRVGDENAPGRKKFSRR